MLDRPVLPVYGGGRRLPVHAAIQDAQAGLGGGLLLRIHAALLPMSDGEILRVASPLPDLVDELTSFEVASGHGLLAVEDDPARPGWRFHYLRKGPVRTEWDGDAGGRAIRRAGHASPADAPTVDELMPRRLWFYANYDCNLQCDYCCVVAGPRADPRWLPSDRILRAADEARSAGFERLFVTGGEPLLRPDLPALIEALTARLPLTVLTNAMLLRGPRWERLRAVITPGRDLAFQVSLDSATPELHDLHRGAGAHGRALDGIATLLAAGARVRLAATLPAAHLDEIPGLHALADQLGIAREDRIFRPLALRGAASEGAPIRPSDIAPELTLDADGWSWHPLSNDPDMRLQAGPHATVGEALTEVRHRLTDLLAGRSARLDRFVCG
ncbi:MAG: radical SAM protein [Candidatus Limnocylindria bacterium]